MLNVIKRHNPIPNVVEVVRCKDCIHRKPVYNILDYYECDVFCNAYGHGYPTKATDFCSYGERETK